MTDEFWKAMAIIIPSFFGTVTSIILIIFNGRINKLHRSINSGLTVRVEEALQAGIYKGVAQEKEAQEKKSNDNNIDVTK